MKGKNYLLITSTLIILGAFTGLILNVLSFFDLINITRSIAVRIDNRIFSVAGFMFCILLLITGITGMVYRERAGIASIVLGYIQLFLFILAIPFLFWSGYGATPIGMLLAIIISIIVFIFYLTGASLNRRAQKTCFYSSI